MSNLGKRAVLMRLTKGMPGEFRQDKTLTEQVKKEHNLGKKSGKWEKALFPPEALAPIKSLDAEADKYHNAVTLPFDKGTGILPAVLIEPYSQKMLEFKSRRKHLVDTHFLANYAKWIDWAVHEHNGTFDTSNYPPRDQMGEKFYFRTEPVPVPDSTHFESNVTSLLGLDAESVNIRVEDATKEAQRVLLSRMIEPLTHMANKLKEDKPKIFETMITNIAEIAELVPKLNLTDDPALNQFAADMERLAKTDTDLLRESKVERTQRQQEAEALMKRLSGYAL